MRDFSADHRWLSINTATLRAQWTLARSSRLRAARHPRHLAVARPGRSDRSRAHRRAASATPACRCRGYCRGGMFPAIDAAGRRAALDDNRRAVDEAQAARARVPGAGRRRPAGRARRGPHRRTCSRRARDGARRHRARRSSTRAGVGMPLAIEPLHPMYAADRACVNTIAQALDLCEALDPGARRCRPRARRRRRRLSRLVGSRARGADRARRRGERLLAYHICDWLVPTRDLLERPRHDGRRRDRPPAHPRLDGGGRVRRLHEVEIFSTENWWKRPADEVLATCIERHRSAV